MEKDPLPVTPTDLEKPRVHLWPKIIIGVFVAILCAAIGMVLKIGLGLVRHPAGEHSAPGATSTLGEVAELDQIATHPRQGFPGKDRVVIACMGLDDNWTDQNILYTTGTRTDTLFLLSLDLKNKKVAVLSIPRDSYVPIAGTDYSDKINSAYATGGPQRTIATIANDFGVRPDYYMVLNIDATKRLVDALGGVEVNVEHQMDYDDNWGHLHVHLMPGFQHLDGDQAVSFVRYRHGNHGISPEDGDPRRIYRQHVLLRAMLVKAKTFSGIMNVNNLVDIGMSSIRTNLSRTQLFDLAVLFQGVQQTDVLTGQIPGVPGTGPHSASIMTLDPVVSKAYIDWMIDGNAEAANALVPIEVWNGTDVHGLAATAASQLVAAGYTQTTVGGSLPGPIRKTTTITDRGVADTSAMAKVQSVLQLPGATAESDPYQPTKSGWTPTPVLRVELGEDFAAKQGVAAAPAPASTTP